MGKGNDNDRYVVPSDEGGWDVVKESHQRAPICVPSARPSTEPGKSSPTPAAERSVSRISKGN
jgi:hypothetical protein